MNSQQILKSSSTAKKTSHKKTSSTSRRSQIKKSLPYNGLSTEEDASIEDGYNGLSAKEYASIKDGNVRNSLNDVASLFSSPITPTFQHNQQIVSNATVAQAQATNPVPIFPSISTLRLKNSKNTIKTEFQGVPTFEVLNSASTCLGQHIARRLVEVGVTDIFSVPGDFNLILLDHLIAQPGLNNIGCCNEINAGYAADGYARCRGVGACVVTFTVGGLSIINAIAGSYSENLPIICLVGGPNSNDYGTNHILHHTIGIPDFSQEAQCFQQVTCYQVSNFNFELITLFYSNDRTSTMYVYYNFIISSPLIFKFYKKYYLIRGFIT